MLIHQVSMENWKCFLHKKTVTLDPRWNLITEHNGYGKTSIFQAIIFGLYGKMPTGFNFQSLKNDPDRNTRVEVLFDTDQGSFVAIKQFSHPNVSEIRDAVTSSVVANGSREVRAWMDAVVPFEIINTMWTDSLITSSILKPQYFKDVVLGEVLAEPSAVLKSLQTDQVMTKKNVQHWEAQVPDHARPSSKVQQDLDQAKSQVKNATQNLHSASEVARAELAKQASMWLESCSDDFEPLSEDEMREVAAADPDSIQRKLHKEESKVACHWTDAGVPPKAAKSAALWGAEHGECPLCGGEWSEDVFDSIMQVVSQGPRNEMEIERLQEMLQEAKLLHEQRHLLDASQEWWRHHKALEACPDWQNILADVDRANQEAWDRVSALEQELALSKMAESASESLQQERERLTLLTDQMTAVKDWITHAASFHSDATMARATETLVQVNPAYVGVYMHDDHISVAKETDQGVMLLDVAQMSNGERTLVACSIILAVQSMLFPGMPLLFDETFAALDEQNLQEIKKMLHLCETQMFVITHNPKWRKEWL